jgi:hypothetical protein
LSVASVSTWSAISVRPAEDIAPFDLEGSFLKGSAENNRQQALTKSAKAQKTPARQGNAAPIYLPLSLFLF